MTPLSSNRVRQKDVSYRFVGQSELTMWAKAYWNVAADHGRIAKLDRDDAPKPPDKVDPAVGKALAQARADKKNADGKSMTQKELATAVNAKPSDVSMDPSP